MGTTLETLQKYTITADASKMRSELESVEKAGKKTEATLGSIASSASKDWGSLEGVFGKAASSIGSIPIPAAAAATAIAGIAAAAVGAGKELFDLAKQGSDFGRTIGSFEAKTGLSAKAVSTLADAAHLSGKELGDLQRPLIYFNDLLVKAQGGSEKASVALRKLGVTDMTDIGTAVGQATTKLNSMAAGQDKLDAAASGFGKRGGAEMITILGKMPKGFEEAQKEAEKLGVTLSEQDVAAAKEFGLAYDTISRQVEVGTAKFALQDAPQISHALQDITKWLGDNSDAWSMWGNRIGYVLKVASYAGQSLGQTYLQVEGIINRIVNFATGGISGQAENWLLEQYHRFDNLARGVTGLATPALTGDMVHGVASGGKGLLSGESDDGSGGGKAGKAKEHVLSPQAKSIIEHASELGISALDYATMLLYEGAGSLSTSTMGGKGGKYMGPAQMGPWEQNHYGIKKGMGFDSYLDKTNQFLTDRGVRPGADLLTIYKAINGGSVNASANASDGNGTIAQHVLQMMAKTRPAAAEMLKGGKGDEYSGEYAKLFKENQDTIAKNQKAIEDDAKHTLDVAQSTLDRWYKAEQLASTQRLDLKRGEAGIAEEVLKGQLQAGLIDEKEYTERVNTLKLNALQDEKTELLAQDETIERSYKIDLLDLAIAKQKKVAENDIALILKRQTDELQSQWDLAHAATKANQRPGMATRDPNAPGYANQSSMSAMDQLGHVVDDKTGLVGGAKLITDAFSQMGEAVGSAVNAFVLYGKVGQSVRQVTAQILASIAQQAAVQSIYELAQGFAMLALAAFGYTPAGPSATMHFAAAAEYGLIAGVAAGLGRAAAGNSFNQTTAGAAGVGSGSTGSAAPGSGSSAPLTPYSRTSPNAYISGSNDSVSRLADSVNALHQKIAGMDPQQILAVAARQNPGSFARQVTQDIRNNSKLGTDLLRNAGTR